MTAQGLDALGDDDAYQNALLSVRRYFDMEPAVETPEAADFDQLVALIETYEAIHYTVPRAASPAALAVVGRSRSEI